MGLDQYAYKTLEPIASVDFIDPEDSELIQDWRKHPNLHGFMVKLYDSKGGSGEMNCDNLQLTLADLNDLEIQVDAGTLPYTNGCFFGTSEPEDRISDLEFIYRAKLCINEGYNIFYSAWW